MIFFIRSFPYQQDHPHPLRTHTLCAGLRPVRSCGWTLRNSRASARSLGVSHVCAWAIISKNTQHPYNIYTNPCAGLQGFWRWTAQMKTGSRWALAQEAQISPEMTRASPWVLKPILTTSWGTNRRNKRCEDVIAYSVIPNAWNWVGLALKLLMLRGITVHPKLTF